MCRSLKVSRSGYYEWRSRPPSDRTQANTALTEHVRRVYAEHKGRAGAPRITKQLRQEGQPVGKNRVARLMRTEQLRAKAARKYKATTNSNHSLPVAPNLLEQDFSADASNRKWVSDITYVATDEGWLYLAVVLDLYSRLVVGWAMSERMTANSYAMHSKWRSGVARSPLASSSTRTVGANTAQAIINAFCGTTAWCAA